MHRLTSSLLRNILKATKIQSRYYNLEFGAPRWDQLKDLSFRVVDTILERLDSETKRQSPIFILFTFNYR